ncbi:MAG: SAM-dependent methyltransferase [Promethearchaeota archaeon]
MKLDKYKRDYYHNLAQKEGYRSRAAYKLLQIDEKFNIFKDVRYVLDLGAAPGSWIQVALKKIKDKKDKKILGVDYKRIGLNFDPKIVKTININIFSDKMEEEIREYFPHGLDLILSDMAPKLSGIKEYDAIKTIELVERAFYFAKLFLKKDKHFVAKVFHSPDLFNLKNELSKSFRKVHLYKPKASRRGNREIYIICKHFLKEDSEINKK